MHLTTCARAADRVLRSGPGTLFSASERCARELPPATPLSSSLFSRGKRALDSENVALVFAHPIPQFFGHRLAAAAFFFL